MPNPPGSFSPKNQISGVQASAQGSLIDAAARAASAAPFLFAEFSEHELANLEIDEDLHGNWTGERLALRQPRIYAIVVKMLAADFPIESISQLAGVSENTVRGIREREPSAIEEHKKRMVGKMVIAKERLLDRVIECAPTMKGAEAAVAFGIITDKHAMAEGAPTHRIEISDARSVDTYRAWMDTVILDGAVIVEPSGTGQAAQTPEQRALPGAPGADPAATPPLPDSGLQTPPTDSQSLDCLDISSIPTEEPTMDATATDAQTGGAGVSGAHGGGQIIDALPPPEI